MVAGLTISTFPPNLDDSSRLQTISTDRHEGLGVGIDDGFDKASCINVHHGLLRVCSFDILGSMGFKRKVIEQRR